MLPPFDVGRTLPALTVAALLVIGGGRAYALDAPITRPDVRALRVKPPASVAAIDEVVRSAGQAGFNALIVDAGRPGVRVALRDDGRDAVQAIIERAHAAGLRVHVAVDVLQAAESGEIPASRDHILYRHPDWVMVPRPLASALLHVDVRSPEYFGTLLRRARADGTPVYVSPLQTAAAGALVDSMREVAARYAADGFQLSTLLLPGREYDFSLASVAEFRAAVRPTLEAGDRSTIDAREALDPFAYVVALPDQWREFRIERLTAFVKRLRAAIREARPQAAVSATIVPEANAALDHAQDWPAWIDGGLVDIVCATIEEATAEALTAAVTALRSAAAPRPFWIGVGAERLTGAGVDAIAAVGRFGADGIVLSSYETLVTPATGGDLLTEIGRTVFHLRH